MPKTKTSELFAGTESFSSVADKFGFDTKTFELDPAFEPDHCVDILKIDINLIPKNLDILWASPPCQGFSVAVIGRNWNHDNTPKTDSARLSVKLVKRTLEIIEQRKPKFWFIENPRGKLRKLPFMVKAMNLMGGVRHTITYCQYGDSRMKPTDIWTNATWWKPRPVCKNGDSCHESAPRGSRTGTQGIQGDKDRSRIPPAVFQEIFSQYESRK